MSPLIRESDRQAPFAFDYNNPAVEKFTNNLFQNKTNFSNPESVRMLTDRFGELIQSMDPSEPEYNNSLSDIVTSGRGMCAAKSVLFGSLLARHTSLEAQAITGQYGQVQNQASYPFSHQWMRITKGSNVYLFDPMYERFAGFEKDGENIYAIDKEGAHFVNLTPACESAIEIVKKMKIQLYDGVDYGGVRLVRSYNGDGYSTYVKNENSLPSQLENQTQFDFEITKDGELEVYNGAIKTDTGNASRYFPIKNFQQVG